MLVCCVQLSVVGAGVGLAGERWLGAVKVAGTAAVVGEVGMPAGSVGRIGGAVDLTADTLDLLTLLTAGVLAGSVVRAGPVAGSSAIALDGPARLTAGVLVEQAEMVITAIAAARRHARNVASLMGR